MAGTLGGALVLIIAAMSVLGVLLGECLGAADCWRDHDRKIVVGLALPVIAAAILATGAVGTARTRRAKPLVVANGFIVLLTSVWWHLWNPLLLTVLALVMGAASVLFWVRSKGPKPVTPETPPQP